MNAKFDGTDLTIDELNNAIGEVKYLLFIKMIQISGNKQVFKVALFKASSVLRETLLKFLYMVSLFPASLELYSFV